MPWGEMTPAVRAEDFGVRVYAYCWMPNHGHLLVETPTLAFAGAKP